MSSRRVESFVVRIVVPGEGSEPMNDWAGRIQHIGTGDQYHFKRIDDLVSVMSLYLGKTASPEATAEIASEPPQK